MSKCLYNLFSTLTTKYTQKFPKFCEEKITSVGFEPTTLALLEQMSYHSLRQILGSSKTVAGTATVLLV